MISNSEVKNLAALARVALTPTEERKLAGELGQILNYVAELKNAPALSADGPDLDKNHNKLREDGGPIPTLEKGEYVKVKKIL